MSQLEEIAKQVAIVCTEYEIALDPIRTKVWMETLKTYSEETVRQAVHLLLADPKIGVYGKPRINDLIAKCEQVQGGDGRPNADEAWAICMPAADERNTVVWTEEMSAAFFQAQPLLDGSRGETAARMAFKSTYERLVNASRAAGVQARWQAALGTEPALRQPALDLAHQKRQLPTPTYKALSFESGTNLKALEPPRKNGKPISHEEGMKMLREALSHVKSSEEKLQELAERRTAEDRLQTENFKQETREKLAAWGMKQGKKFVNDGYREDIE